MAAFPPLREHAAPPPWLTSRHAVILSLYPVHSTNAILLLPVGYDMRTVGKQCLKLVFLVQIEIWSSKD